jgi:hypothetical protein
MSARRGRRRGISVAQSGWRRWDTGVVSHAGDHAGRWAEGGRRTKRHGVGGEAWWWCWCCVGRLLRWCLRSRHLSLPRRSSRFLHPKLAPNQVRQRGGSSYPRSNSSRSSSLTPPGSRTTLNPPHRTTTIPNRARRPTNLSHQIRILFIVIVHASCSSSSCAASIILSREIDFTIACKVTCLTAATTSDVCVEVSDLRAVVFAVAYFAA